MRSKIVDQDSSRKILRVINSRHAKKILETTSKAPMSATQINRSCRIPLTKVYQWVQKLQDLKFLKISGMINEEGRKVRLYQSMVKMIVINPNNYPAFSVEVMGIGAPRKCDVCSSKNFTLTYYPKPNKCEYQCIDCELEHAKTASHLLKEEKQKTVFLKFMLNTK